jgi:hypothetical protein
MQSAHKCNFKCIIDTHFDRTIYWGFDYNHIKIMLEIQYKYNEQNSLYNN